MLKHADKKPRLLDSYALNPSSALTHWWGKSANKSNPDASEGELELLMTAGAMTSLSNLMPSLFPEPLGLYTHDGRTTFGQIHSSAEMASVFGRRQLEAPTRIGVERDGSVTTIRSASSANLAKHTAYCFGEVCEWLWDVVASHIDIMIKSKLPKHHAAAKHTLRATSGDGWPSSDEQFERTAKALSAALPMQEADMHTPMNIEGVMDVISEGVLLSSGIKVDMEVLKDHIAPVCLELEPTKFLAKTLMRCDIMEAVLGKSLATQLRAYVFESDWQLPVVSLLDGSSLAQSILNELLESRKQLHEVRMHLAEGNASCARQVLGTSLAMTSSGGERTWQEKKGIHAREHLFNATAKAVANNIALRYIGSVMAPTIVNHEALSASASNIDRNVREFSVILNDAIELYAKDLISKARDRKAFSGFSFISDESPPEWAKFAGVRFQITWIYYLMFEAVDKWDLPAYLTEMPFNIMAYLCDIVNCPGKTGPIVYDALSKQWSRFGVSAEDCAAGVGDGGGENEGTHGVHSHIESTNGSYVRRRCLLHLPWRVCDQGLAMMGSLHDETKAISTHVHDGITFQRFKSIATTTPNSGGLNLFGQDSEQYVFMFHRACPSNQDDRPKTTCDLLRWLAPRQTTLAKLAKKDMEQRKLSSHHAKLAVKSLCDPRRCALRRIAGILLNKGLYLFHFTEKRQHVAIHDALSTLFERAAQIISDLRIDSHVLDWLGLKEEDLATLNVTAEESWVKLAVRMEDSCNSADQDEMMPHCQEFHTKVSMKMRTHLSLTAKNIERTTWLAARFAQTFATVLSLFHVRPGQTLSDRVRPSQTLFQLRSTHQTFVRHGETMPTPPMSHIPDIPDGLCIHISAHSFPNLAASIPKASLV